MPAAAVIPAPIAYIKVVAVKKLVVEFRIPPRQRLKRSVRLGWGSCVSDSLWYAISLVCHQVQKFTLKKLECLKRAISA